MKSLINQPVSIVRPDTCTLPAGGFPARRKPLLCGRLLPAVQLQKLALVPQDGGDFLAHGGGEFAVNHYGNGFARGRLFHDRFETFGWCRGSFLFAASWAIFFRKLAPGFTLRGKVQQV